jgi:hypothetical protein
VRLLVASLVGLEGVSVSVSASVSASVSNKQLGDEKVSVLPPNFCHPDRGPAHARLKMVSVRSPMNIALKEPLRVQGALARTLVIAKQESCAQFFTSTPTVN